MAALCAYPSPGNVQEPQNVVERAVILSTAAATLCDYVFKSTVARTVDAAELAFLLLARTGLRLGEGLAFNGRTPTDDGSGSEPRGPWTASSKCFRARVLAEW
jgi:DNA-binding NtrC family response regulator